MENLVIYKSSKADELKGYAMFYEYDKKRADNLVYWSNSCGELINDMDAEDLPNELKRVYDKIWTDKYTVSCYLCQFNGKYGIAIEAEYDYTDDVSVTPDSLAAYARAVAVLLSQKFEHFKCDVIFTNHINIWDNHKDNTDALVTVFVPWDIGKAGFDIIATQCDDNCMYPSFL